MPDNFRSVDRLLIRFRCHLSVGTCLGWLVGRFFVLVGRSFRLVDWSIGLVGRSGALLPGHLVGL